MKKSNGFRFLAGPALAAALIVPLAGGCSSAEDLKNAGSCEANIEAKAKAFEASVDALVKVSGEMKGSLAVACSNIAKDLGDTTAPEITDPKNVEDATVTEACNKASAALDVAIAASGKLAISIEGGKCEVNAQAQFNCEASCDVEGKCEAPSIEARCEPGELSGKCEGECKANATCQGSATVKANCEGTCSGSCEGECSANFSGTCGGTCNGTCDGNTSSGTTCAGKCEGECTAQANGSCGGSCKGTCTGECKLAATANIDCGAEATCKGECSVALTAPKCEAELKPLECDIDAECKAGCNGQGSISAECTPPSVKIQANGNATLTATLETNLPAILNVVAQGEIVAKAAVDVAGKAIDVGAEVAAAAGCLAQFGASFAAKMEASLKASASVDVSVKASASASGSASGGT